MSAFGGNSGKVCISLYSFPAAVIDISHAEHVIKGLNMLKYGFDLKHLTT